VNNFFLSPENGRYYLGVQFTYEGRIYPGNLASMNELGFVEVIVQPMPDPTFYVVGNVNDDGTWNYTDKPVPEVKVNLIDTAKGNTLNTLATSDWYVTRLTETSDPIPTDWAGYRGGVRDAFDSYEAAVTASTTLNELETVGTTVSFPQAPGSGPVSVYVTSVLGSNLLTVDGYDNGQGGYTALTETEYSQFVVGQVANAFGKIQTGTLITEVLPVAGQLRIDSNAEISDTFLLNVKWEADIPTFTGTFFTGRNGADMNPSYYGSFSCSDAGITEDLTTVFIPGAGVTLPYLPNQDPPGFDSFGNVFVGSDYQIQLKYGVEVFGTITAQSGANLQFNFNGSQVGGGGSSSSQK
jgi:hypothetical protein